MRLIKRLVAFRYISIACMISLIAPMGLTLLSPGAVSAQETTIKIAIVPFRNISRMSGDMYATMTTDAFAVELMRSGKFDTTRAEIMDRKLMDLGYKTKTDRSMKVNISQFELQQLGRELGVDWIASGDIHDINIDTGRKRADVSIAIRILDVGTGQWVNGAHAPGGSQSRIGYTSSRENDWVVEAINNAASNAVGSILRYMIPTATIIGVVSGSNEVLLNRGEDSGLRPGLEMIVVRREGIGYASHEDVVGRIKVTRITDSDAYAKIVNAPQGVRPEDRVIAIYELPDGEASDPGSMAASSDNKARISNTSKWIWGLVALVGLAALFKVGSGGNSVTPSDGGAITVLSGSADSAIPTTGSEYGGVFLGWGPPSGVATPTSYTVYKNAATITPGAASITPALQSSGLFNGCTNYGMDPSVVADIPATYHIVGSGIPTMAVRATCLTRPVASSTAHGGEYTFTSLKNVIFTIGTPSGVADQYVIEVSLSADFASRGTGDYTVFVSPVLPKNTSWDSGTWLSDSAEFRNLKGAHTLYWRVGCRYTGDTNYPAACAPYIWDTGNRKHTRWVYSKDVKSFDVNL